MRNEQKIFWKIGKWLGAGLLGLALSFWIIAVADPPKQRTKSSIVKSDLHNIFLACKAYWADKGSDKNCTVDIAKLPTYGYIQSSDVSVSGNGTATSFIARGQHAKSNKSFVMNTIGDIVRE